jgi:hypothetical protein
MVQDLLYRETSICENYDEPGIPATQLRKITMDLPKTHHFDYYHNPEFEGASPLNGKRRHFNSQIDHLDNQEKLLTA